MKMARSGDTGTRRCHRPRTVNGFASLHSSPPLTCIEPSPSIVGFDLDFRSGDGAAIPHAFGLHCRHGFADGGEECIAGNRHTVAAQAIYGQGEVMAWKLRCRGT